MARSKGTGGITRLEKLPKGKCRRWKLTVVKDGKTKERKIRGTYAQAEIELKKFELELENKQRESLLFSDYVDLWHNRRVKSGELAAQTLAREKGIIKRLNFVFGEYDLSELSRDVIQDGLLDMKNGNNPSKTKLSGTTMNKTFTLMKQILNEAALSSLIPCNPMSTLKAPKRDTKEKNAIPFDEVQRFLALLEARPLDAHIIAIKLMVLAGLRRSEVVGLEWRDIRGGMVHVGRSVAELTGEVKEPKSSAGVRAVPMLMQLETSLQAWQLIQEKKLSFLGIKQTPETPIVTSDVGTRMAAQNLWRWWTKDRKTFGVSCNLHELRHTFLTMLANSGASAQSLKSIAGWSSIEMANIYVHDDEAANRGAVNALESRF